MVDAGYVSDEELGELYRNAYAVVLVSLAEGFGLPLVEAAACGTPHLVVSDIPVFRWICGDAAHYVDPLEVDSIADGLRQVLRRPAADRRSTSADSTGTPAPVHLGGLSPTSARAVGEPTGAADPTRREQPSPADRRDSPSCWPPPVDRALLAEALRTCSAQIGVRFRGVVSVPDEDSLPEDRTLLADWRVVTGTRGLAAQRNAGLDALDDADVVAFFDDDAVLRPDYLANALRFLDRHPDVVALTGRVLLDGATTGEVAGRRKRPRPWRRRRRNRPTGTWRRDPRALRLQLRGARPGRAAASGSTNACRCTPGWRTMTSPGAACGAAGWPRSTTA